MLSDVPVSFRRYSKNCQKLKKILKDTYAALDQINTNLKLGKEITADLINEKIFTTLDNRLNLIPKLLILGQNCHAKALLINSLFKQTILPLYSCRWRYLTFSYGMTKNIRLIFNHEYELVENLKAHEKSWTTIPEEDLKRKDDEGSVEQCSSLEIELFNVLLKDDVQIIVPPDCDTEKLSKILGKHSNSILPVIIYAVSENSLSDNDIQEIRQVKTIYDLPLLFISVSNDQGNSVESLTESEQHFLQCDNDSKVITKMEKLQDQLIRLGYINDTEMNKTEIITTKYLDLNSLYNTLICGKSLDDNLKPFIRNVLKSNLLKISSLLSEIHNKCLKKFILSAFDMAREIQITPKRIVYAQEVELKLCKNLMKIANEQQEKITEIIQNTLQEMKSNVHDVLAGYNQIDDSGQSTKIRILEIQQLVLKRLQNSVASQIVQSVGCLQENFTGTLKRCLESLEKSCRELEGNLTASDALKQILTAAYNIDLKSSTSFSIIHSFLDRLRTLLSNFTLPWTSSSNVQHNFQWQAQIVINIIDSLSASKLAKTISVQFQEHVKSSHEAFLLAMRSIENQLSGHLEQTEEQRILIRKRHAPKFARLALESTSFCDYISYGIPKQIKEIGRGQYGVVVSCEPWDGINPCAFKSVVPADDRHWNDLAMEFYYTRSIPEHPRIVKLRGSVIDYNYGGGNSAVLLMMERMTRDLHTGLRSGLSWITRLQIAIDVVEGIRYLHSQGLVHRDIKLKNVLLDLENRAKLTDFGFCIPEAMMSGSIVGTPVHMAPELLSGRYDSSVDVYAFGILFWYICAGRVKLPNHFDHFQNKEQLWNNVRKGIRPECLPHFDSGCWKLMEQCWAAEPSARPLLGYVQPRLESIYEKAKMDAEGCEDNDKNANNLVDNE